MQHRLSYILVGLIVLFWYFSAVPVHSQAVHIEYFHSRDCQACTATDPIIRDIQDKYKDNVTVEWQDAASSDGFRIWEGYGFTSIPAVVINNKTRISAYYISEKNLDGAIASYLEGREPPDDLNEGPVPASDNTQILFIFIMGIMAGISPCLMAILGFILGHTTGNSKNGADGIARAMVFGLGLILTYLVLGLLVIVFRGSFGDLKAFSILAGALSIAIGLNLVGIIKIPVTFDAYIKKLSRKSVLTWTGLFLLGIVFSFLKVPCSTPMILVLVDRILVSDVTNGILWLLAFIAGILTPFIAIGVIGGYALAEQLRTYKTYINMVNGAIVIVLGIWAIFV